MLALLIIRNNLHFETICVFKVRIMSQVTKQKYDGKDFITLMRNETRQIHNLSDSLVQSKFIITGEYIQYF